MQRINKLVRSDVRGPWLISLILLTFVVFAREFGRLAELLIQKQADVIVTGKVVLCLLPSILVFSLPFSLLIGIMIGLSRLSGDNEITALRAVGTSSWQLVRPLLLYGVVTALLTALGTIYLLPRANWELRLLREEIRTAPAYTQLKPRVFFDQFPGLLLYVEDVDREHSEWKGILVADLRAPGEERFILADRGYLAEANSRHWVQLHFERGSVYALSNVSPERATVSRFRTLDIPLELPAEAEVQKVKRPHDKTVSELLEDLWEGSGEVRRSSRVELNRRLALASAPLFFLLLGVGLAARPSRGGRGYGFVIGVVAAFSYYVVFATGSSLARLGTLPVLAGVWGADLLTLGIGWASLHTADRPSRLAMWVASSRLGSLLCCLSDRIRLTAGKTGRFLRTALGRRSTVRSYVRFRIAQILDLFMARTFLLYFAASLGVCLALVYLFTFFEIVDEVVANEIPYRMVGEYFFFLLPHFAIQLAPFGVLLGILITLGWLERTNQLTALKTCGISLYRTIVPLLVTTVAVTGVIFVVQEEVAPFANRRQDYLRGIIKGRPPQVSEPGDHWIFGQNQRLYHYRLFHPQLRRFADFSVLQLDLKGGRIEEIVSARQALWDPRQQVWRMSQGWHRTFDPNSFAPFEEYVLAVSEGPEFFGQEVRESNKMKYVELKKYIENLQLGGFDVDYLKTELYKKLSFPLLSLVMALLGIPFALTLGRRGALYGVAAGVVLGIAAWGAFGVFDVLGANSLLAPALAAWGANALFGAGAVLLLSWVRT